MFCASSEDLPSSMHTSSHHIRPGHTSCQDGFKFAFLPHCNALLLQAVSQCEATGKIRVKKWDLLHVATGPGHIASHVLRHERIMAKEEPAHQT